MPPLTLEQVLARSMRLPRQRTPRYVSKLYRGNNPTIAHAQHTQHSSRIGARASELAEPGLFNPNYTDAAAPRGRRSDGFTVSARQEKLNFFEVMEREDASRQAGRLSIHRSDHLVRNSADLTTFLNAVQYTGDWVDGLRAFAEATALPAFEALLHDTINESNSNSNNDNSSAAATSARSSETAAPRRTAADPHPLPASSLSRTGVNPNAGHILTLLDMCAKSGQYALVEKIGTFFAPVFPEAFARTVELIAAHATAAAVETSTTPSTSSTAVLGWRAAFAYVTQRCPLPAAEVPVEAFNVCLRGCEEAKDWRGALEVVRAMGPNPLQGWTSIEEENDAMQRSEAASHSEEASTARASAAPTSLSTPPQPDVVSYAMLIATLEQAGKDQLASEVLNRLPAVEKEEITASYAALIYVWSNQVLHRHRRLF